MKKDIHPKFYLADYTDISSGKVFKIGSTIQKINVEISSVSHPHYTGQEKTLDIENRVAAFNTRATIAKDLKDKVENKRNKRKARMTKVSKVEAGKSLTLRDMLKNIA